MAAQRTYLAIDLKSFYASVECVDRHLDPLTTNLVVADASRTEKTICLAVSPSLKAYKIPGRARLFEAVQRVKEVNAQRLQTAIRQKKAVRGEDGKYHFASTSFDANALNADPALGLSYIVAPPRMQRYLDVSTQIYKTYLKYVSPADIYPYSIDEVFIDVTGYARVYKRAVLKPESKEFKTVSCPKIAKNCTIREETIERIFRGETVSLDSAQQVAMALGKAVEQMFEVEIDRRPMTKKTMREYNLFIRSVLNYANDNYGTSLQMPMIKASGRKGKSVDCLHSDEVEALQAALKECSMLEKAIVLCLLNTGVRRGELAGLTWKDVNFRDGTIHVSKSLLVFPNYGYQLTTTKESNIRDVDVAPEFMAFLKDYHEQWKSRKKLMGASWQKNLEKKGAKYAQSLLDLRGNDFVICNDYGFPINPDSYAALVRRVGKKAGIEKIHPHMFRHTFVSILLSNPNIGVATVAAEAGHAQPSTTLAIYTQVYDRRRDEIRKQMSKELYK